MKQIYPQYSAEYSEKGWLGPLDDDRQPSQGGQQPQGQQHGGTQGPQESGPQNQQQGRSQGQQQIGPQSQQQGGPRRRQQGGYGQETQEYSQQIQRQSTSHAGDDLLLEEAMSEDMRLSLQGIIEAVKVCEWCAEQCIDEGPHMAECVRRCRDVADIATLTLQLLTRNSIFGPQAAELFVSAAEACAQECAQHRHRHCQECVTVLSRAVTSTHQLLTSIGNRQETGGPQQSGQL